MTPIEEAEELFNSVIRLCAEGLEFMSKFAPGTRRKSMSKSLEITHCAKCYYLGAIQPTGTTTGCSGYCMHSQMLREVLDVYNQIDPSCPLPDYTEMSKTGIWVEIPEVRPDGRCSRACPLFSNTFVCPHRKNYAPYLGCPRHKS